MADAIVEEPEALDLIDAFVDDSANDEQPHDQSDMSSLDSRAEIAPAPESEGPDIQLDTSEPEPVKIEAELPEGARDVHAGPTAEAEKGLLAALKAEREHRQRLEGQLHDTSESYEKLSGRLDKLNSMMAPIEEAQALDPNEDPLGYTVQQMDRMNQRFDKLEEGQAETQQTAQLNQMRDHVTKLEGQFKETHADYDAAYSHFFTSLDSQFEIMGYDPQTRAQQLGQYAAGITAQALQSGRNPAEVVYMMAQKMGYTTPAPSNGTTQPAPVADTQIIQPPRATGSLSNMAGGQAARPVTLDALDSMTDAEFDAATDGDNWKKMWGN